MYMVMRKYTRNGEVQWQPAHKNAQLHIDLIDAGQEMLAILGAVGDGEYIAGTFQIFRVEQILDEELERVLRRASANAQEGVERMIDRYTRGGTK